MVIVPPWDEGQHLTITQLSLPLRYLCVLPRYLLILPVVRVYLALADD